MPWKETSPMEQRLEFVLRWAKHETSMAELCRAYEISRQTGYALVASFQAEGLDGLKPHSRAPRHDPNAIGEEVCAAVLRAKAAHPSWGPKKLKPLRDEADSIQQQWPVASTRGAILTRAGLTVPRRPARAHVPPRTQPFGSVRQPNDTWCADFKGWFRTGDGVRCDPLTISDAQSRLLLRCQAMHHGTDANRSSHCLKRRFGSMACRSGCAPTTGRRLPRSVLAVCRRYRSGGSNWASFRSGSILVDRARTVGTNASTAR